MQHFPSSPPSRRISLSGESVASLLWDEQESFQSFSAAIFPSPPKVSNSSQPVPKTLDLSLADSPSSLDNSGSPMTDEVFTDNVNSSPFLALRAPKKKKKSKARPQRSRLLARNNPGRPLTRSITEEELPGHNISAYQLRPRRPKVKKSDFVYDFLILCVLF